MRERERETRKQCERNFDGGSEVRHFSAVTIGLWRGLQIQATPKPDP